MGFAVRPSLLVSAYHRRRTDAARPTRSRRAAARENVIGVGARVVSVVCGEAADRFAGKPRQPSDVVVAVLDLRLGIELT